MPLQVKTIVNAVQHFPGFVFQDIRLERYRDGHARCLEITIEPHGGIPAKCSRCRRPAPGYDRRAAVRTRPRMALTSRLNSWHLMRA